MKLRRLLPVLLPVLLAWFLAASLVAVSAPADAVSQRRADPGKDFPHMPRYCATPKEMIPSKPVLCHLDTFVASHPTILLWGDSHAWMMIPALRQAAQHQGINLVAAVMGSCPPMDPRLKPGQSAVSCDHNNDMAIRFVEGLAQGDQKLAVLLGGSWQRYYHALKTHDRSDYVGTQAVKMQQQTPRLMRRLASDRISVTVNGQVPTVPEKKQTCRAGELPYSCDLPKSASVPDAQGTKQWVRQLMRPLPTKKLINLVPALCDKSVCHGLIGKTHTWFDDLHLSATRSRRLSPYFDPIISEVLTAEAPPPSPGSGGSGGCTLVILC